MIRTINCRCVISFCAISSYDKAVLAPKPDINVAVTPTTLTGTPEGLFYRKRAPDSASFLS